jgi:glucokinase
MMNKSQIPAIGIDLGGTKILAGLVSACRLLGEPIKVPTPKGADNIIEAILEIIANFQKDSLVLGVGISTAGIVDPNSGEVIGSTGNLPGWEGTALKTIIQNKTALRCVVENDANAAAYGECHASGLGHNTCVIMVTLGTGIGGGVILHGRLYRGAHFAGGEIGHIKISMDNRRHCTCGLWDCWETYGSGRGLQATGWELLGNVSESQSSMVPLRDRLTTQNIIDAANSGDLIAKKAIELYHEHIACGMVALCHSLDPDCFVVSGGMSKFVDLKLLKDLLVDRTLPRVGEKLEIYPSCLGEAAGLVGAGQLVLDAVTEVEQVSVAG